MLAEDAAERGLNEQAIELCKATALERFEAESGARAPVEGLSLGLAEVTVLIILGGLAFVFAFFTTTLGYLRAKIAAAERELQAEEDRAQEIDAPTSELRR